MNRLSRFLLFLFLSLWVGRINAQWDSLHSKTTLTYVFTRKKAVANKQNEERVVYNKKYLVTVTIDSVINLGEQRRLIVLNKCINSLLLNETTPIYKDSVLNEVQAINISGIPYYDAEKDYSGNQATIIYQVQRGSYLITVPKLFFKQQLRHADKIEQLSALLIRAIADPVKFGVYDIGKPYIYFQGYSLPLKYFIFNEALGSAGDSANLSLGFMQYQRTMVIKNAVCGNVKEYTEFFRTAKFRDVFLCPQYGIVRSRSIAWDKAKLTTYVNSLELLSAKNQ